MPLTTHLPEDVAESVVLYSISDDDVERIRALGAKLTGEIVQIVDQFYTWLPSLREYHHFFGNADEVARVKAMQQEYWRDFFRAKIDKHYVERRRRVGNVHATIGLSLQGYFSAMNQMLLILLEHARRLESSDEAARTIEALTKMVHFDTSLVVSAFSDLTSQTIAEQSEAIVAMSTPVITISDDILLLPAVGVIDSVRARDIMSAMLTRIRDTEAKVFILDISGVAVVDTAVANHIIKMTRASKLMGCECVVSGLSPAVAQTIITLEVDVTAMNTRATLKDALTHAFAQTGVRLTKVTA